MQKNTDIVADIHAFNRFCSDILDRLDCNGESPLSSLNGRECEEIRAAMETVRRRLTKATTNFVIRPFRESDVDYVISGQLRLYAAEYGFTSEVWKSYVTDGVHDLIDRFDAEKDCLYILECDGVPSGSVAITHTDGNTAQLRFFFIESTMRGLGVGRKLIDRVVDFCGEKGYDRIILWTFSTLYAARHLYESKGFRITETQQNNDWGEPILEERWDLEL